MVDHVVSLNTVGAGVGGGVGAALQWLGDLLQGGVRWLLLNRVEQRLVDSSVDSLGAAAAPGGDGLEVGDPDGIATDVEGLVSSDGEEDGDPLD